MKSTDQLIDQLTEKLEPVQPEKAWRTPAFVGLVLTTYVFALSQSIFSLRPDFAFQFQRVSYWAVLFLPVIMVVLCFRKTMASTLVLKERYSVLIGFRSLLLGWLLIYLASVTLYSLGALAPGSGIKLQGIDFICTGLVLLTAAPIFLGLPLVLSRMYVAHRKEAGRASLWLGLGVGLYLINMHCPYGSYGHHLLGHGVVLFLAVLVIYKPFEFLYHKILSRSDQRRIKKI